MEYAVARRISYVFPSLGPGRGFALATRSRIAIVPYFVFVGRRALPFTLAVLDETLAHTAELEDAIDSWPGVIHPLMATQRISFRTGLFTRRVAFRIDRETTVRVRPTRPELAQFQQLFSGDPRVV